ncbi:MAG: adenylate kinase [Thermococcaceae archaeon]|nr:adenylate kinase [Thermococcaceae archaeon]MDK2914581.1 adenylate kinase [Thermococcaceae archaeon]
MGGEVILLTGPPLNGRDEYISEALKGADGESYAYYHVFDWLREVGKESGVKITRKNVLDFAISHPDIMNEIRDEAFERIRKEIDESDKRVHLVSTPSLFRWGSGSVIGFTLSNLKLLKPDRVIIVLDDVLSVRRRIINDPEWFERFGENPENIKLTTLVMWREDAINHVKTLVHELKKEGINVRYVLQFGIRHPHQVFLDLIFRENEKPLVYLSYPMTGHEEEYYHRVRGFYEKLSEHFTVLDPGALDDWWVVAEYDNQVDQNPNIKKIKIKHLLDGDVVEELDREDIEQATDILRRQLVERDFNLVDVSKAIAVYHYAEGVSAGVISEMAEAYRTLAAIYLYYPFKRRPSPFMEFYGMQNPSRRTMFKDEDEMIRAMVEEKEYWTKA